MTHEHKTYPINIPGVGDLQCESPSTRKTDDGKAKHTAKKHKSGGLLKAGRNFRFNGAERGGSPNLAKETKYVRSGGPARHEARVTRNIAHQEFLKARAAARRIAGTNRSFDRRSLKAAEHADKAISE